MKVGKKGTTEVVFGEKKVKDYLQAIPWHDKFLIGHNMSGFDSMLLAWRFNVHPAMWGCTLAMARPRHAIGVGGSLAKLAAHYGLEAKDSTALMRTRGKHLKDFTPNEIEDMKFYNRHDTELCSQLFYKLLPDFSQEELRLIDLTTRMLVKPVFRTDTSLLKITLREEQMRKKLALLELAQGMNLTDEGINNALAHKERGALLDLINQLSGNVDKVAELVREELASAPKFAKRLISLGVEPPKKVSPSDPAKVTYAFARTDPEFTVLLEHENPLVRAAVQARFDVKSTILESRVESFLEVAEATRGKMPIALNYYAAHTSRWGGSMDLNQQNLPRIDQNNPKPSDALRNSLRAPNGHKVVVADLSGIELRVNHSLWKVPYSTSLWSSDPAADLYRAAGAIEYSCKPEEVTKVQRQLEKTKALGLGFGAGAPKFRLVAKSMGGIDLTAREAEVAVQSWRGRHPEITRGWRRCHEALDAIYQGARMDIDPAGLCVTSKEGIHTPKGVIRYPALRKVAADERAEWWYGEGRHATRIYAGKVDENIVQHLARNVFAGNLLTIQKRYPIAKIDHDELTVVVREEEAEKALEFMNKVMRTSPSWWPELVVHSEGSIGDSYGGAK